MDWKTISNYVLLVGLFVPGLSGMMLGCSIPDGAAPIRLQNQLPGHLMTNASRRSGWIQMELKHGSPSEEHWSEANKDAHSKCREWGYEEAEVTGTHHFEHSGSSTRGYECRGMISPPSEATTASGPEAESTVGNLQNQLPSHLMTHASRRIGWIQMELKHGSPSEAHWFEAGKDAHSKCREWGYEEAEVTGTHHFEFLESSTRIYECRGTISPPSEATTASGPGDDAEAVRTTEERPDKMQAPIEQGHSEMQAAVVTMHRGVAVLRSLAEQGDAQAQDLVAEMQDDLAELQRRAEQGDPEAQRALAFMLLVTSDKPLQMETWRCFKRFDRNKATALFTLVRMRSGGEDAIGEVSIAGVSHMAQFQVAGLNRRWDWGCEERTGCRYAFSITPDDTGSYYDFSVSDDGRARPSQTFECQLSP